MKVAIVHDWLVTYAGAERALEQILLCYPKADLFSVVDFIPKEQRDFLLNKRSKTTFIQKLPFSRSKYRNYLPLMPLAVEQLDLSGYDMIISSSHAVAKGVITGPDQLHVSYVYSPIRYAWDLQHQYLAESGLNKSIKGWIARYLLHRIRKWDIRTANGVDYFIGISKFISRRINKVYRRDSEVIYPPVTVEDIGISTERDEFYLTASRMVPYKKMGLIVETFNSLKDKKLIVIGDGPEFKRIKRNAGRNITFTGFQPRKELIRFMQKARAFIFAAEEDFGIIPLEAQACGTPVIAFNKGGASETIKGLESQNPTGVFFEEQTVNSLKEAIEEFESNSEKILSENCRRNALQFNPERFKEEFKSSVQSKWLEFQEQRSSSFQAKKVSLQLINKK